VGEDAGADGDHTGAGGDDGDGDDGMSDDLGTQGDRAATAGELAAFAAKRRAEAADDAMFPDEVETPIDVPARDRFGRYRGLKSFRTSPWDPNESLPPSYARIFTLPHWRRTQRRVLSELELAERAAHTLDRASFLSAAAAKRDAR